MNDLTDKYPIEGNVPGCPIEGRTMLPPLAMGLLKDVLEGAGCTKAM